MVPLEFKFYESFSWILAYYVVIGLWAYKVKANLLPQLFLKNLVQRSIS